MIKKLKKTIRSHERTCWDLLIAFRLYIIFFILIYPLIFFIVLLKYLSVVGIVILGFSFWFIIKYVLFESRKKQIGLFFSMLLITCIISANFFFGLIISIIQMNVISIILGIFICLGSTIYFLIMISQRPFRKINCELTKKKSEWSMRGKNKIYRISIFRHSLVFWLLISNTLLLLPYPIYIHSPKNSTIFLNQNPYPDTEFGIWTYGQSLDDRKEDEDEYLDNKSLQMLSDAGIYFIYGINERNFDSKFIHRITRCKDYNIEVHLSINPNFWTYTNIWSFSDLKDEIEEILMICKDFNFLGDPITTFVYDMETIIDTPFPFYGFNLDYVNKIKEYHRIQKKFIEFNDYIKFNYDLDVRITTDIFQAVDFNDGDNDLMTLLGLMEDNNADMSYMVYRRNNFGQNQILDHMRFLHSGDRIILNAWKYAGYLCWKNIDCAIQDCRLVLGYPDKTFKLEIWELSHFLVSYGIDGLEKLVEAICEVDSSDWPPIVVTNRFPYSFFWDTVFYGIIMIDVYGPLFRFLYGAY